MGRRGSAKPLLVGSIPTRASILNQGRVAEPVYARALQLSKLAGGSPASVTESTQKRSSRGEVSKGDLGSEGSSGENPGCSSERTRGGIGR